MAKYTDLVIEWNEKPDFTRIAGINHEWNREMIISDCGLPENMKGKRAAFLYPASVADQELNLLKRQAQRYGITPTGYINTTVGITEFYIKQQAVRNEDKSLIVVDVKDNFAEISYLSQEKKNYKIRDTNRIDFEIEARNRLLLVIVEIRRLLYKQGISKAVILLSGKIWLSQKAVCMIKEKFKEHSVMSYRPDAAALLGSVIYTNKHSKSYTWCVFSENFETYHYKNILGRVNKLNITQTEGYWKLLQAIMDEQKEVIFRGSMDDMYAIYDALSVDYPETRIIWDFVKSEYYRNENNLKINMVYKNSGRTLMKKIRRKACRILQECTDQKNTWPDSEIIRKLYMYMTRHYCYTKEKPVDGAYPDYTYTLETLLRGGVCQGYAVSMNYLSKIIQVPVDYICGKVEGRDFGGHAWNVIPTTGGAYRHLDLTWDLASGRSEEELRYYMLDDIGMRARRHLIWDKKEYPVCS